MIKFLPFFITVLSFIFLLIVLFVNLSGGLYINSSVNKKSANALVVPSRNPKSPPIKIQTVNAQEKPIEYYPPISVRIPAIGLSANVVEVGLDSIGRMDVPDNFIDVGWFNLGFKPGENGSMVFDGHHDDFQENSAVFYYLDQLQSGDEIYVTDQKGKQYTYAVTDTKNFPVDALPMQQIFNSIDKARLNLITCAGTWDSSIQTYNQRTVIYSELKM